MLSPPYSRGVSLSIPFQSRNERAPLRPSGVTADGGRVKIRIHKLESKYQPTTCVQSKH